jgi:outer membrane receptor for ferrienterochelin and colicin
LSMYVHMGVLICLLLAPLRLVAQEDEGIEGEFALLEDALAADEVESASKHRQSIFWSPSAITVLNRDDIRNSGATTLADLLRRVPGFDVYETKYSYPLVGARALTDESNNLVLVLVDGRETIAELTGITFWSGLPFDLEEVERIEVIRGPGSTLYGANAFAAVLNITTVPDRPAGHGGLVLMGGEEGYYHLFAGTGESWSLADGTLSFGAGLGVDGKRSPSDSSHRLLDIYRAHGHLRYRRGRSLELFVDTGVVGGGGLFFTHIGDMQVSDAINYWILGKAELALGDMTRLKVQLYYNGWKGGFHSRTDFSAYNISIATPPDFKLDSPTLDGQVQLDVHLTDDLLLISGANLRYITLDCENYEPEHLSEFRGAAFVHAQWILLDMLQLTGGLRVDLSTEIEPALSPRAVMVYRPQPNHAIRLGYGLAFRKPSLYESQVHPKVFDFNPATPEIVEKMETSMGNGNLVNEEVHSVEAGWRAHFLQERLQVSVDLFFNVYQDTIFFKVDIQERLGMPDIVNSILRYENDDEDIYAIGGEAALTWRLNDAWSFWGNLGVRRVTMAESGDRVVSEPVLRVNFGGRFSPVEGLMADLALHYVSAYEPLLADPDNIFNEREPFPLGNDFLLFARLGYLFPFDSDRKMEAGLIVRAPLGLPFREYPGVSIERTVQSVTASDFGGEKLGRWVSVYLRSTF